MIAQETHIAFLTDKWSKIMTKQIETLTAGHPLFCSLDNTRVRFVRMVDAVTVEVASNEDGKILPDYRHISQVKAR